ncbi:hypothetical protein HDV00_004278 [Rhizophlyctis rosea]|nr:hypothetical protein HDV00_004278 [Rhizophlyctis rosea]
MGRKDFRADVEELNDLYKAKLKGRTPVKGLSEGDEDGMVKFQFSFDENSWISVSICLDGSTGWLFVDDCTEDEKASRGSKILSEISVSAQPIREIVFKCLAALCHQLTLHDGFLAVFRDSSDMDTDPTARSPRDDRETGIKRTRHDTSDAEASDDNSESVDDDDEDEGEGVDVSDEEPMDEDALDELMYSHHTGVSPNKKGLILRDAAQMRDAGYVYVGYLTHAAEDGFILYNSMPVSSLLQSGVLTADQCDAWNLSHTAYIVTLMKFEPDYVDVVDKKGNCYIVGLRLDVNNPETALEKQPHIQFRVLASDKAQVATRDAQAAFQAITANTNADTGVRKEDQTTSVTQFMLSWTLSDLLNTRFLQLLAYRLHYQLGWAGAELVFRERHAIAGEVGNSAFLSPTSRDATADWNEANAADQEEATKANKAGFRDDLYSLRSEGGSDDYQDHLNFPILVMRYVLRRITLASRFCLVCHRRTAEDLEAIRPFVCESPLCTYQYLQIGLGPSIELELLHNRTVVDMLISFAYIGAANYGGVASTTNQRYYGGVATPLEPFPYGVGYSDVKEITSPAANIKRWAGVDIYCEWDNEDPEAAPRVGDVLEVKTAISLCKILRKQNANLELQFNHYGRTFKPKVASVGQGSHMILEAPVAFESPRVNSGTKIPFTILRKQYVGWPVDKPTDPASLMEDHKLFTETLDKMPCVDVMVKVLERIRRGSVSMEDKPAQQLDTPPPEPPTQDQMNVEEEPDPYADPFENLDPKMFLVQTTTLNLRPFLDRVDKLLYPLLRWIICSNRSYFRELVDPREQIVGVEAKYVQFKMVMGSPDKETRFMREREKECPASQGKVQSLWAFHDHGLDQATSTGYAMASYNGGYNGKQWLPSKLRIKHCMSLNEIVNAPSKFQSTNPHLVVQHIDWVQTRFLLVYPAEDDLAQQQHAYPYQPSTAAGQTPTGITEARQGVIYLNMDSTIRVRGNRGEIKVPAALVASAHSNAATLTMTKSEVAERTMESWDFDNGFWALNTAAGREHGDGDEEEEGDFLDEAFDFSGGAGGSGRSGASSAEGEARSGKGKGAERKADAAMEDLDMLPPPEYATPSATKALHKELRVLLKVQQMVEERERGWVLDVEGVTNLYQWTVRLTHFEEGLPLQEDLKKRGADAVKEGITLEVRFGPEYPMTPPYVRVVKPRFLPFAQGGGGHVTAGGSICMDLLTMGGWSPAYTMEATLLQIRMALTSTEPRPARLDGTRGNVVYSPGEAIQAFVRVAQQHGWTVPKGWNELFSGSGNGGDGF